MPTYDSPSEINLARRLIEKRNLTPPIQILSLLRNYAEVEFVTFPVQVDGVCLYLKRLDRSPKVLIERRSSNVRKRFTAAHELGHILIPWHIGSIVDHLIISETEESIYIDQEREANRFASELLMPTQWLSELLATINEPDLALIAIMEQAEVSMQASAIRLIACLPQGYIVAHTANNIVLWSSRSPGTLAAPLSKGVDIQALDTFPSNTMKKVIHHRNEAYHFWRFGEAAAIARSNPSIWRHLLNSIVSDIEADPERRRKMLQSINGITSNANGWVRDNRRIGTVKSAMLQRLHAAASQDLRVAQLLEHSLFEEFCDCRAASYILAKP